MSDRKPLVSVNSRKGQIEISGTSETDCGTGPHSGTDTRFSFGDPETSAIVRFLATGSVRPSAACGNFEQCDGNPHTCRCGYMRDSHTPNALGGQK